MLAREARQTPAGRAICRTPAALEALFANDNGEARGSALAPFTRSLEAARRWLRGKAIPRRRRRQAARLALLPGVRATLKVKSLRTAMAWSAAFAMNAPAVGRRKGLLHHVGFTVSIPAADKPSLTKRLEKLIARPGFSGAQPGAPSRWSRERSSAWEPLRPSLVAEVRYDHVSGVASGTAPSSCGGAGQVAWSVYAGAAVASDPSRLGALGSTCCELDVTQFPPKPRRTQTRRPQVSTKRWRNIADLAGGERARLAGLGWNASIVAVGDRAKAPPAAHWRPDLWSGQRGRQGRVLAIVRRLAQECAALDLPWPERSADVGSALRVITCCWRQA